MLYLDSTICAEFPVPRQRPAARCWTMELMRQREDFETKKGGFGLGELQPVFTQLLEGEPMLSLCSLPKDQQDQQEQQDQQKTVEVYVFLHINIQHNYTMLI